MAFKKGFIHLFKLSLRKDIFQISQGAYAPIEFVLDNFIFLLRLNVKAKCYSLNTLPSLPFGTRFGNSSPTLLNSLWPTTIHSFLHACKQSLFILILFDIFYSSFFKSAIRSLRPGLDSAF